MAELSQQRSRPPALGDLLAWARRCLEEAGIDDPGLEARLLVEHFTGTTRAEAISTPDRAVEGVEAVRAAVGQRCAGTPVHRILGYRAFYGLSLKLSPATLEPRPDTETLVDLAAEHARRVAEDCGCCRILDLGTGTGAIALALLSIVPEAMVTATDISLDALETACLNAQLNGYTERFTALRSKWLDDVEGVFDLIVSNPPYIRTGDLKTLQREVREHDPLAALDGGADGLNAYRSIAAHAHRYLTEYGLIAVETGHDQKAEVVGIFAERGYRAVDAARDLGGRDRAIAFKIDSPSAPKMTG